MFPLWDIKFKVVFVLENKIIKLRKKQKYKSAQSSS